MNEKVILFGPDDNLVGVVTPAVGAQSPVGVVMLNSGVVHRIGPHRISVKLSRHLAKLGFSCMRFDYSGVGDSRMPRDASDFRRQAVSDTKAAMDWMEREHGIHTFALYGMCSGAVNAYSTALEDPRVKGVFMFDGYVYRTVKSQFYYLRALGATKAPAMVSKAIVRRLRRAIAKAGAGVPARVTVSTDNPTPAEFADGAQRLFDRGVKLAFLFSGHVLSLYSYPGQLRDTFRNHSFAAHVPTHFHPQMDHSAALLDCQQQLVTMATEWVSSVAAGEVTLAQPGVHAKSSASGAVK